MFVRLSPLSFFRDPSSSNPDQNAITRHLGFCALLGLAILICGCSLGKTRKEASVKAAKNVNSSAAELSSRNQSLLGMYSAEIESAADKIMFESPTTDGRRQALAWKAEAIPILQNTMLKTDPVAAMVDTWAFVYQMKNFFQQPALKTQLGQLQPVAAEALSRMDAQMEQLVRTAAPKANIADMRKRIESWAAEHPIQRGLPGRESMDAELIDRVGKSDLGPVASVRALEQGMGDLTARLDAYNVYTPKQARWQAELLLSDLGQDPHVATAMSSLGAISDAAGKASGNIDRMPELMQQARAAVLADVQGQRLAVQDFVDQQRALTLSVLRQERIATVAALNGERLGATSDLRGERQVVLAALHNEQVEAMNSIRGMGESTLKEVDNRGRSLIDHFFVRALELLLLTLVLLAIGAWLLVRQFTRSAGRRDEGRPERVVYRAA
jgi:PBP1b-binding outer membrane lipoprotein LpoB